MLSDLGADVVKLEPPEGDVTRVFGVRRGNQGAYFVQQNAGKRNVCIDLAHPDGPALVRRIAACADVVLENFRPGVLAKYGLDYAALSEGHPELIMASISGFGQQGPESMRAAYAGIIHAEYGWLDRQSRLAGTQPLDSQLSVADTTTGLHALVGILAALRVRDRTGEGQYIDMAMVDALMIVDDYTQFALEGVSPAPVSGGETWNGVGGYVIMHGDFRWIWRRATEVLGVEDPTPPDADLPTKIRVRRQAWQDYLLSFEDRTSMLAALDKARIAWGSIRTTAEALDSPTLAHRASIVEVDDRVGGSRRVVQSPYRFSRSESGVRGPAPLLGEHNEAVLSEWVGMTSDDIAALVDAKVLVSEA
jgi:crotonobetainyl-CoA:carnitine CoA-transferase CaiB-like acyl-CoA transferase